MFDARVRRTAPEAGTLPPKVQNSLSDLAALGCLHMDEREVGQGPAARLREGRIGLRFRGDRREIHGPGLFGGMAAGWIVGPGAGCGVDRVYGPGPESEFIEVGRERLAGGLALPRHALCGA